MSSLKSVSLSTFAAAALVACSSTPVTTPMATTPSSSMSSSADRSAANAGAATAMQRAAPAPGAAATTLPAHRDPSSLIASERSVYFDFDEYRIKPAYAALIERHGKYLAANPSLRIKVEGHTDERGGAEYNLALGQRRAEAVQRALQIYGAQASQMEPVSWGEERAQTDAADESTWARNRHADLQYPKN